ncbi:hypothetical protein ABZX40_03935 [Streptomyces sp. NPDC004610]|uniref:HIT family protein n=1 Tax=unclassified Streptomyces TaxID=2593676 RepID=UPI0033BBCF92
MTADALAGIPGCLACDLTAGRVPLPGGILLRAGSWVVEHCVGALGLGTLVVKPVRHVVHVADLTGPEAADMGPLLRRVSATVTAVTAPEQVYVCLWSHAGGVPGHLHFVVQPVDRATVVRYDAFGPRLQVALGEEGRVPEAGEVERVCDRLRGALGG